MATLEDKILGEKKHYYCSSDEEDGDDYVSDNGSEKGGNGGGLEATAATPMNAGKWEGSSKNTGPKGVIKDWQRFKQLEIEKRQEQEMERLELSKKLCLTMTNTEAQPAKPQPQEEDPDLEALMNDEQFLEEFRKQRMEEMMLASRLPKYGHVFHLNTGEEFLKAIDDEDKSTTVIVHIYEENVKPCKMMNQSLAQLAKQYPNVKFCRMVGSSAGMSHSFKIDGIPALIVYKEGNVIGNFVRITDELGEEFYDGDVENFLIENGIIFDRFCVPDIVQAGTGEDDDAGSDWSLE
uniref:Phosducin-like protein n=1 Tax=Lygus hesperus TaxID=30085 RepID=A0A0A9VZ40_LYGHE